MSLIWDSNAVPSLAGQGNVLAYGPSALAAMGANWLYEITGDLRALDLMVRFSDKCVLLPTLAHTISGTLTRFRSRADRKIIMVLLPMINSVLALRDSNTTGSTIWTGKKNLGTLRISRSHLTSHSWTGGLL